MGINIAQLAVFIIVIWLSGTTCMTWEEREDQRISAKCKAHNHLPGPFCEDDYELIDECCVKCTKCFAGHGKPATSTDQALCTDVCIPCENGKTYSETESTLSCQQCTVCDNRFLKRETVKPCTRLSDTKCGACKPGYYDPSSDGDPREPCMRCKPGIPGCPAETPSTPLKTASVTPMPLPLPNHKPPQIPTIGKLHGKTGAQKRKGTQSTGHAVNGPVVMVVLGFLAAFVMVVMVAYIKRGDVYYVILQKLKEVRARRQASRQASRQNLVEDNHLADVRTHNLTYADGGDNPVDLTAVNMTQLGTTHGHIDSGYDSTSLTTSGGAIVSRDRQDEAHSYRADPSHGEGSDRQMPTVLEEVHIQSLLEAHAVSTRATVGDDESVEMIGQKSIDEQAEYISEQFDKERHLSEEASVASTSSESLVGKDDVQVEIKVDGNKDKVTVKVNRCKCSHKKGKANKAASMQGQQTEGEDHENATLLENNICSSCGQATDLYRRV